MRGMLAATGLLLAALAGEAGRDSGFHLRGLGSPWGDWRFDREIKLPAEYTNLSGVFILPQSRPERLEIMALMDGRHTRRHPEQALTRWTLDASTGTLAFVEGHALEEPFMDLEDLALDPRSHDSPRFLIVDEGAPGPGLMGSGCSTLLHVVTPEGRPVHPAIELKEVSDSQKNVCAEGLIVRPNGNGLRLYVLKERNPDHSAPRIFEYDYVEPGGAVLIGSRLAGQEGILDMTAGAINPEGTHLLVLNRFLMQLVSLSIVDPPLGHFPISGQASYRMLEKDILQYHQSDFPMAEGLSVWGSHLLMAMDNNAEAVGMPPDKAPRLLWFRREDSPPR